jgi:hypothetical protein
MGRILRRRRAWDTERAAALSAVLNELSKFAVRRSATTLGNPLNTTFIRHSMSTPPRGPLTSRILTVTRSTARPNLPTRARVVRLIFARSSSSRETPSILMLAGVMGTTASRSRFLVIVQPQSQRRLRMFIVRRYGNAYPAMAKVRDAENARGL